MKRSTRSSAQSSETAAVKAPSRAFARRIRFAGLTLAAIVALVMVNLYFATHNGAPATTHFEFTAQPNLLLDAPPEVRALSSQEFRDRLFAGLRRDMQPGKSLADLRSALGGPKFGARLAATGSQAGGSSGPEPPIWDPAILSDSQDGQADWRIELKAPADEAEVGVLLRGGEPAFAVGERAVNTYGIAWRDANGEEHYELHLLRDGKAVIENPYKVAHDVRGMRGPRN